jgi:hypothetical protein
MNFSFVFLLRDFYNLLMKTIKKKFYFKIIDAIYQ